MSLKGKKVLVYLNENQLAPHGGPLGVGFYLNRELKKAGIDNIVFLKKNTTLEQRGATPKLAKYKFYQILSNIKKVRKYQILFDDSRWTLRHDEIFDYNAIHFHTTLSMFECRNDLKEYKGIVILTSHSPVPLSQEIYDNLKPYERVLFKKTYSKLSVIDNYAFNRADIIIFPCKEAEESYSKNMPYFNLIKEKRNFYYAVTGIDTLVPKNSRDEVRNELGLDDSGFMIFNACSTADKFTNQYIEILNHILQ